MIIGFLKRKIKTMDLLLIVFFMISIVTNAIEKSIKLPENNILEPRCNDSTIFANNKNAVETQNTSINNNGIIKVESLKKKINEKYGGQENGISNYQDMPNFSVVNNGMITTNVEYIDNERELEVHASGNGVSLASTKSMSLDNLKNIGIIFGKVNATAGNGVNLQYSSSYLNGAGNGVSMYGMQGTLKTFFNNGRIEGESLSIGGKTDNYSADGNSSLSGNGVSLASHILEIGNFENMGRIKGFAKAIGGTSSGSNSAVLQESGNGVIFYSTNTLKTSNILNNGIFQGNGIGENSGDYNVSRKSGNGLVVYGMIPETETSETLNKIEYFDKEIKNKGTILGYTELNGKIPSYFNSGNGIMLQGLTKNGVITNIGTIAGNKSAINIEKYSDYSDNNLVTGTINNYGILAGENILTLDLENVTDNKKQISGINNGIFVLLNSDQSVKKIINGEKREDVINGEISENDSSTLASNLGKKENVVINGAGVSKGALVVDQDLTLSNSVVNGYKTSLYLENNSNFIGSNVTFNGGGTKGEIEVIKGDTNNNEITLNDNSIINGAINLGAGNDKLTFDTTAQINGNLDGSDGTEDILSFNNTQSNKGKNNLNVLYDIKGFETINVNGNVTLFEKSKITGASEVNLKGENLILRVDPTLTSNGKIIGHALYENEGVLKTQGGNLVLGLNGIGENQIISMGKTTIENNMNDSWWKDTDHLKTNSLVLDAKLENNGKDIKVTLKESIPIISPGEEGGPTTSIPATPIIPPGKPGGPTTSIPATPIIPPGEEGGPTTSIPATPIIPPGKPGGPTTSIPATPIIPPGEEGGPITSIPATPIIPPGKPGGPVTSIPIPPEKPGDLTTSVPIPESIPSKDSVILTIDSILYEKLNKIYQSIITANEIGKLENTTLLENKTYTESLGELLTILDQMYANNPYAYTLKSSRDSLKLINDNISYLTIKPKKDEIIVQGKTLYSGVKNDNITSGKNYYGFDTGHRNYKIITNTVGGISTIEYGLSDETSVGGVLAGNNQYVKFKESSKIKNNSLYLGAFIKRDIGNIRLMSGVGYQYTFANVDRKVANKYDSFSTGDRYNINSLNAFVEAKYKYNTNKNWSLEPKIKLNYYYIEQNKINEGYTPGQISMGIDRANSNTLDVEVGIDLVKKHYLDSGKLKNILSLEVINTMGNKSKELKGYVLGKEKNGKKFDIQGVELPRTSGKVSYNLEIEKNNGMIYTVGVSLEFAKDYNRNVDVSVGVGYKF